MMKRLIKNGRRFVVYCKTQYELERLQDERNARIVSKRLREELRRREAREAIQDGCA